MSHENAAALEKDPVGGLLLRYSMPAIAGMVVFSLYNIVDSVFIGRWVGPLALSGLAVAFPVMNLTFAFGMLVGIGGASICSIRMGRKDMDGAERALGNVVVLNLVAGVLFGLLCLAFIDPVLLAFGASADTLAYAGDFMRVILLGLPCTYTMFNLNHVMRASGYPRKAMLSAVVTVGFNIALAPLFIYLLDWGMRGAALATVLSQGMGMLWVLRHFWDRESTLHFRPGIYRLRADVIRGILSIGLSPFLMNICACAVVALINIGLGQYGGDLAVGAYGVINRVLMVFVMVLMGLTQGMQPIVGYNYGAKRMGRVRLALRYGVLAGVGIATFGFLAAECFPRFISGLFTDDAVTIDFAVTGMRLSALVFPLVGCQIVVINFFQSIGRAKLSIFLSLTRQLLFLIPGLIFFPRFWGLNGIWISIPAADVLAFITCMGVFVMFRREIRPSGNGPSPAVGQKEQGHEL